MAWTRFVAACLCSASLAVVGACGDDDGGSDNPDASVPDDDAAPEVDAGGTPTYTLTALLGEVSAPAVPSAGDGLLAVTYFVPDPVAPAFEETPGAPLDCKVWDYTPAQFAASAGVDVGEIQWTIENGPPMPPCNYVDGRGYLCIGATGSGGDIGEVDTNVFSLTDANVTFGADQVGRHIEITGATEGGNNGLFPIVDVAGDHTIIFVNQGPGAAEGDPKVADDTTMSYQALAGMGPAGLDDPMEDNATVTFALTANDDSPIESFDIDLNVPTDFTLDDDSLALLNDIPLDGNEFTLGCSGAGGECGSAQASIVQILTTDADVSGLPPNGMPFPDTKAVLMRCIVPLSGSVTVPAEASAILADSGATRVQAVFLRATPAMDLDRPWLTLLAPHMQAGYTTP